MQDTVYQPGHIRCQLPMYPAGSYNISAANKYGLATNSLRKKYDSRGRAYDLQYYGDITNIEPTVGGLNGGTQLTITGTGFGINNTILVHGEPCDQVSATFEKIVCQTKKWTKGEHLLLQENQTETGEIFAGGRGLKRYVFPAPVGQPSGGIAFSGWGCGSRQCTHNRTYHAGNQATDGFSGDYLRVAHTAVVIDKPVCSHATYTANLASCNQSHMTVAFDLNENTGDSSNQNKKLRTGENFSISFQYRSNRPWKMKSENQALSRGITSTQINASVMSDSAPIIHIDASSPLQTLQPAQTRQPAVQSVKVHGRDMNVLKFDGVDDHLPGITVTSQELTIVAVLQPTPIAGTSSATVVAPLLRHYTEGVWQYSTAPWYTQPSKTVQINELTCAKAYLYRVGGAELCTAGEQNEGDVCAYDGTALQSYCTIVDNSFRCLRCGQSGNRGQGGSNEPHVLTPTIITAVTTSRQDRVYADGKLVSESLPTKCSGECSITISGLFHSALSQADYFKGYVAELAIYDRALPASERELIEDTLMRTWGVEGTNPHGQFQYYEGILSVLPSDTIQWNGKDIVWNGGGNTGTQLHRYTGAEKFKYRYTAFPGALGGLVGAWGNNIINKRANTVFLPQETVVYLARHNNWHMPQDSYMCGGSCPVSSWTLLSTASASEIHLDSAGHVKDQRVYKKIFSPGSYSLDTYSAMYLFTSSTPSVMNFELISEIGSVHSTSGIVDRVWLEISSLRIAEMDQGNNVENPVIVDMSYYSKADFAFVEESYTSFFKGVNSTSALSLLGQQSVGGKTTSPEATGPTHQPDFRASPETRAALHAIFNQTTATISLLPGLAHNGQLGNPVMRFSASAANFQSADCVSINTSLTNGKAYMVAVALKPHMSVTNGIATIFSAVDESADLRFVITRNKKLSLKSSISAGIISAEVVNDEWQVLVVLKNERGFLLRLNGESVGYIELSDSNDKEVQFSMLDQCHHAGSSSGGFKGDVGEVRIFTQGLDETLSDHIVDVENELRNKWLGSSVSAGDVESQSGGDIYQSVYSSSSMAGSLSAMTTDDYSTISGKWRKMNPSQYLVVARGQFVAPSTGTYMFTLAGNLHARLTLGKQDQADFLRSTSLYTNYPTGRQDHPHYIIAGESLVSGTSNDRLVSTAGTAEFVMESSGNAVIYDLKTGAKIWSTNTGGECDSQICTAPYRFVMELNGNCALYNAKNPSGSNSAIWSAKAVTLSLQVQTSKASKADSPSDVLVEFMEDGSNNTYGIQQYFVTQTQGKGAVTKKTFAFSSWPTKLRLKIKGENAWGIYEVKICRHDGGDCVTLLKDPNGLQGRAYPRWLNESEGYWIDNEDLRCQSELELDIPASSSKELGLEPKLLAIYNSGQLTSRDHSDETIWEAGSGINTDNLKYFTPGPIFEQRGENPFLPHPSQGNLVSEQWSFNSWQQSMRPEDYSTALMATSRGLCLSFGLELVRCNATSSLWRYDASTHQIIGFGDVKPRSRRNRCLEVPSDAWSWNPSDLNGTVPVVALCNADTVRQRWHVETGDTDAATQYVRRLRNYASRTCLEVTNVSVALRECQKTDVATLHQTWHWPIPGIGEQGTNESN
jgi:hypothetical protein